MRTASSSASPSITSSDVEEAVSLGRTFFNDDIRLAPATGAFRCSIVPGSIGPVTAGQVTYGGRVTVRVAGAPDSYAVHLLDGGTFDISNRGHGSTLTPSFASVRRPDEPFDLTGWHKGRERLIIVKVDRGALEAELRRLLQVDQMGKIPFAPSLNVAAGRGAEWAKLARAGLFAGQASDGLASNPLIAAQVSSMLMSGLLLAAEHPFRDALDAPASRMTAPHIDRAVRYIEEHAQDPLTVPGIAAAVGTTPRNLQRGFAEYLQTTPHALLTRVRMDLAHRDLLTASAETTTVTQVAARWGFLNQGRFAAKYRAWYGVTPSATLRDT